MSQLRARLRDPSRRARSALEYQLDQLSHAARADKKNSAESKNLVQAAPPVYAWALNKQAAHGGQDQVWHDVIGRDANLRCGALPNSTGTRSGLLRVRVARIPEAQACPSAALAPPH